MRRAIVLVLAFFILTGLSAQTTIPPYIEPAKALFPYDKKLTNLQSDHLDLMTKLHGDDQFLCLSFAKDMAIAQLRIKTSLIIALMYKQGTEQGAKFTAGDINLEYQETILFFKSYAKYNKDSLATVKNPLLAQLGMEGVRIMEDSKDQIERLYKAVNAPISNF